MTQWAVLWFWPTSGKNPFLVSLCSSPCEIDASGHYLHLRKLYESQEWYGEGGGRRVRDGEHMYTCGGLILIFGKTNTIM